MSEEDAYWAERREREEYEFARRERRRKTLPWRIVAGVVVFGALFGLFYGLALAA